MEDRAAVLAVEGHSLSVMEDGVPLVPPDPKLSRRAHEESLMKDVSVALLMLVSRDGWRSRRYRRDDRRRFSFPPPPPTAAMLVTSRMPP
jgi:hypothetical protein